MTKVGKLRSTEMKKKPTNKLLPSPLSGGNHCKHLAYFPLVFIPVHIFIHKIILNECLFYLVLFHLYSAYISMSLQTLQNIILRDFVLFCFAALEIKPRAFVLSYIPGFLIFSLETGSH